ncbi:MAG: hypothetical protein M0Q90_13350 [Bacteroidales bacterium]|nr:hypothetical protein [Bacteroidales bacterium]
MKKSSYQFLSLTLILFLSGCSSVTVLNSWKSDDSNAIKDNNFIVIARTANTQTRIAFENEMVKQLSERGMKATASFTKFPKIDPDQEVTEERVNEIIATLKNDGFNAVVLTVLKEVENLTQTTVEGGGNYYGNYPRYYRGFGGYYRNPMSYSRYGTLMPETYTTTTTQNYVLETVIYNLDESNEKQLVAVVTSKIEDPGSASNTAVQYVKAITKSFDQK